MWKCVSKPNSVILILGAYECSFCHKAVVAFAESEAKTKNPSILNFKYCPYCGAIHNGDINS